MKQYRFAFYTTEKARTKYWGEILALGAKVHGDVVDLMPKSDMLPPDYDGGGSLGLSMSTRRALDAHLEAGRHYLLFDKGYFGRGMYWRVSVDAWQPLAYFQRFKRAPDRFKELGIRTESFQKASDEGPIVFAGACQNYSNFFKLGNVNEYNANVLNLLRQNTKRPIVYRPNPSWFKNHHDEFQPVHELFAGVTLSVGGSFKDVLKDCHLMVTHGTSAAVFALQNGVSSMVLGEGIAKPLSLGPTWDSIEVPYWPSDKERQQFFNDLAYCQWTIDELKSGEAWQELRLIFAAIEGNHKDPVLDDVLNQYKIMHKSPKYFRGISTCNYRSEIGRLIRKTVSDSLLDFGSGKGLQYQDPYLLQVSWGIEKITCYDPGVPEFSTLPTGKFDAVICCDVMEHVPEHAVKETLATIFSLAKKFVFFVITTAPAKKELPDGRNCHVTVKPEEWWLDQIAEAKGSSDIYVRVITKGEDNE
jgi:Methyltransferase domain